MTHQRLFGRSSNILTVRVWRSTTCEGSSPGLRTSSIHTYPYVAPHTAKIHTLITLGIRYRTKPLVFEARNGVPCGFDSHRPLHFLLSGVSLRCPRGAT